MYKMYYQYICILSGQSWKKRMYKAHFQDVPKSTRTSNCTGSFQDIQIQSYLVLKFPGLLHIISWCPESFQDLINLYTYIISCCQSVTLLIVGHDIIKATLGIAYIEWLMLFYYIPYIWYNCLRNYYKGWYISWMKMSYKYKDIYHLTNHFNVEKKTL